MLKRLRWPTIQMTYSLTLMSTKGVGDLGRYDEHVEVTL
jgi:hypothetical protein